MNTSPIHTRTLECKHCHHRWVTQKHQDDRVLICPCCRTWRYDTDAQFVSKRELARIAKLIKRKSK